MKMHGPRMAIDERNRTVLVFALMAISMSGFEWLRFLLTPAADEGWISRFATIAFSSVVAALFCHLILRFQQTNHGSGHERTSDRLADEQLRYLITHDALTGLFNRAHLESELARYQSSDHYPISILMADIDDLKQTNDTHGHHCGDILLQEAAAALSHIAAGDGLAARVGGDEFVVVLPQSDIIAGELAIERIRKELACLNAANKAPSLSLSVGVATAFKGDCLADLLRAADRRMYEDKRRRKSGTIHPSACLASYSQTIAAS
jgi:diguanylate cyclase (GGDEF)-like protein